MPVDLSQALRQLLALSYELQTALSDPSDQEDIERLFQERDKLLAQLQALPEEQRQLEPELRALWLEIQALDQESLEMLAEQQAGLRQSSSELNTAHSAIRAYLPQEYHESHYIEEQT